MKNRINLLPPEVLARRSARQRNSLVLGGVAALILGVFTVYLLSVLKVSQAQQLLTETQLRADQVGKAMEQFKVYEQRKQAVEARLALINEAKTGEVRWSDLLTQIAKIIPSDVWLTSFTADANGISASAVAFSYQAVATTIVRLTAMKNLTAITLSSTSASGDDQGIRKVTFSFTARLAGTQPAAPSAKPSGGG